MSDVADKSHFRLLDLPSELLDQVLECLSPVALAKVCQTCKLLNIYGSAERLWQACLADCTPHNDHSYKPFKSWKEMYRTHYPYWFIPKHKIWFADRTCLSSPLIGQLILARYDYRIGSIEGYRLVAKDSESDHGFGWTHDPTVHIHPFQPRVRMYIDDPVLKLDQGAFESGKNRLQQEAVLARTAFHNFNFNSLQTYLFPTIPIPLKYQAPSMDLWPPKTIPSSERVRVESPSAFRGLSHKPTNESQMSTKTFRLRQRFKPNPGYNHHPFETLLSEGVLTYSTISPEYYTPTAEKPYQGIWVGDYSGHGCEFLLIVQSTPLEAQSLPQVVDYRDLVNDFIPEIEPHLPHPSEPDPPGHEGRLDAIKLTGDPNIPRGERSWIAQDISRTGLVRIAQEPEFRGARVVKSSGHIAHDAFTEDQYIPCQLIMINENRLAQYWIEMRHISFFTRVDIDKHLRIS